MYNLLYCLKTYVNVDTALVQKIFTIALQHEFLPLNLACTSRALLNKPSNFRIKQLEHSGRVMVFSQ